MAFYIEGLSSDPHYEPLFQWESKPTGWTYPYAGGGAPIQAETVPKRAFLRSSHKTVPDFIVLSPEWGVSRAFRDIVETLEPGVHQFFPVDVLRKTGEPFGKDYFVLNICRRIDAIVIPKSDVQWIYSDIARRPVLHRGKGRTEFTLSEPAIRGKHLWRGDRQMRTATFCSDELMAKIQEAKLMKLRVVPAAESDEPPTEF